MTYPAIYNHIIKHKVAPVSIETAINLQGIKLFQVDISASGGTGKNGDGEEEEENEAVR